MPATFTVGVPSSSAIIYHCWGQRERSSCSLLCLVRFQELASCCALIRCTVIISTFKPKVKSPKGQAVALNKAAKPKPTKVHIAQEIKFDLSLSRLSICIDIVANLGVVFAPAPMYKMHLQAINGLDSTLTVNTGFQNSQALFVLASWLQCAGAGAIPAIQSLALCILQARSLLAADAGQPGPGADAAIGTLFGALAVLQAGGQMVLGVRTLHSLFSRRLTYVPRSLSCSDWCTAGLSQPSPRPSSRPLLPSCSPPSRQSCWYAARFPRSRESLLSGGGAG